MAVQFGHDVQEFLAVCSHEYDRLRRACLHMRLGGTPESVATWVEMTAGFAGLQHPGRFVDGGIENSALDVGRDLSLNGISAIRPCRFAGSGGGAGRDRRVLHLATFLPRIGGHAQTVLRWMRKDRKSCHSVVVTSQGVNEIPLSIAQEVSASGGYLAVLPDGARFVDRALWVRAFAGRHADVVVMHLAPNDVVPVIAFAERGPPVGLVNLADQAFWIGASVADEVVHLREIGSQTSRELRSTRGDSVLPIPLDERVDSRDRAEIRCRLGLSENEVILLSIGRSIKYAPTARHNFFRTASTILNRRKNSRLLLVGVNAEDHANADGFVKHERMHFIGPVDDPGAFQCAADIYLEGFPFGSQTALLESVLCSIPCVLAHSPGTALLATQDIALEGVVSVPEDETAYVEEVIELIDNPEKRRAIGGELGKRVREHHVDESWNEQLEGIYARLGGLHHLAREMPWTEGMARDVDLAVSEYHSTRYPVSNRLGRVRARARLDANSVSYWLRQRGDFHGACKSLLAVGRIGGVNALTALEAGKLLLRWTATKLGPVWGAR